jgi:hypothetical protein
MMREISAIHNSAPSTLRVAVGFVECAVTLWCPQLGAPPADTVPAEIRSPKRGANYAGGQRQHRGRRGIRGYCLDQTRTPAAWCWYLKPALRLTRRVRPSFLRILIRHPRPLPDRQPDARPMLGGALEDAPRFVFDQQVGGRPSARLVLEIDVGQRVRLSLSDS